MTEKIGVHQKKGLNPIKPKSFKPNRTTKEVLALVQNKFASHFGKVEPFWFAVSHKEATEALKHFIHFSLANFGTYQDAMAQGEHFLFHSAISQYLNIGLLTPRQVCQAIEKAYYQGKAPISSAEGFIHDLV